MRTQKLVAVACLVAASVSVTRADDAKESAARLERLKAALGTVKSQVVGSPDPPLPYRAVRALPELKLSTPIFAITEPGSGKLYFVDREKAGDATRICRTTENPATGKYDVLVTLPNKGIAYSIAFHPQFAKNGWIFVGWSSAEGEGGKRSAKVTRYTVSRKEPFSIDAKSAVEIVKWPSNGHMGAAVTFGKDGMLYVTTGDGTSDSDTDETGQEMDHLLAKLLRIDVDRPDDGRMYSVPQDNPFVGVEGVRPETWAYGFRNPWRITVDTETGDIWVGNNGQDLWEQAFLVERGANYGWSVYEGGHPFYLERKLGPTPHVKPTVDQPHSVARSLTGGVVYYGKKHPDLRGAYIYGDYSTGKIWGVKVRKGKVVWHKELADTTLQISAFVMDADGELLVVDHRPKQEGGFYALVPNKAETNPELFPRTLSASGLFESVRGHRPHAGMIPYSVNSPLWSDGAIKERYVFLPPGDEKVQIRAKRGWNFPDHTVIVKSFAFPDDPKKSDSKRWIETRFLVKQDGDWVGYSYEWNDEQTEATLVEAGGRDRTFPFATADGVKQQRWRFPSRTECMVCHSRAANYILGLSTLQMNKLHRYGPAEAQQLEVWQWLDVLRGDWNKTLQSVLRSQLKVDGREDPVVAKSVEQLAAIQKPRAKLTPQMLLDAPGGFDRMPNPYDEGADLNLRARAYLHANCAQCHVEAGGGNAQMQLEFTTPLEKMKIVDVVPVHHKYGIENPRLIAPGDPESSVLLHRVAMRGRGQMPQLATSKVDAAAVKMLRRWIESLKASQ